MAKLAASAWTVLPGSKKDIERLRADCRRLVRRRAAIAAGLGAVPIPGVDVLSDVSLFALMVEDINQAFGLTPGQIDRLHPRYRTLAYEAAAGIGGMMVGKLVTREMVLALLRRTGMAGLGRYAGKFVPLAGQVAAAAIGFAVFRKMGYQHVDACAAVAQDVLDKTT
ncbi:hypothetical protein [Massilia sp. TS11]|uniref:hypothetical protein n=1 Tax=Massilia sp. TS11 TaxID=2908003 RepID=UPI001ED9EF84|nr:hypothetical protein [Massilia sp. TS11]MCG2585765.1 hypothetical protein [Massilia sp. TS11]